MPANRAGRSDDRITGLARRHKAVQICNRPRWHANFSKTRLKHFRAKLCCDDFNLFDRFKPGFIFVAGIAEGRTGGNTTG